MSAVRRPRPAFGRLLRHWRSVRGLSQLALSQEVETTTRHLSYLENGRSRPGRDLVLRIAAALDLPLRARNELLEAAGLGPEFPERPIGSAGLAPYRAAVLGVIAAVDPYPAFVVDGILDLHDTNAAAARMLKMAFANEGPSNLAEAFLAPGPARDMIDNFPEVAWSLHDRLARARGPLAESEAAVALRGRIERHLRDVPRPPMDAVGDPVICPTFRVGAQRVRTVGMTMRFGPSRDVTLEELTVDLLYPRDEEAAAFFRSLA